MTKNITPKIALETIQKHCENQNSCMNCPINQVCDFCFMGQPKNWDLSEIGEEE